MTDATRRGFLAAAGAGAATAAAIAAAPGSLAAPGAGSSDRKDAPADGQPLVAHISDTKSGDIALLVGEHEVVLHDPALVARLTRAARK